MPRSKQTRQWYVADIIIEIVVQRDPRNVVHINTVLVRAANDEEAYLKAIELGRSAGRGFLSESCR